MKLCQYLKRHGLNGIEGIYSTYRSGDETTIRRIAGECGLLISGGSDFHGVQVRQSQIGEQLERWTTMEQDIQKLLRRIDR